MLNIAFAMSFFHQLSLLWGQILSPKLKEEIVHYFWLQGRNVMVNICDGAKLLSSQQLGRKTKKDQSTERE